MGLFLNKKISDLEHFVFTSAIEKDEDKITMAANRIEELLGYHVVNNNRESFQDIVDMIYAVQRVDFFDSCSVKESAIMTIIRAGNKLFYEKFRDNSYGKNSSRFSYLVRKIVFNSDAIKHRIKNHLEIDIEVEDQFISNIELGGAIDKSYVEVQIAIDESKYVAYMLTTDNYLTIEEIDRIIERDLRKVYSLFDYRVITNTFYEKITMQV